jgi:hypothetical protein
MPDRISRRRFLLAFAIWSALCGSAPAKTAYDDPQTAEGWTWAQIKQGKPANFNERCKTPALDPRKEDETRWEHNCRRLEAKFLIDALTAAPWRDQIPFAGVQVVGARIVGNIDLHNARLNRELSIQGSRIENNVDLNSMRTDSSVGFINSLIRGSFSAIQFHGGQSLWFWSTRFKQAVMLAMARADGFVALDGAKFDDQLTADALQVGSNLSMGLNASFNNVSLVGAKVADRVIMTSATFEGTLDADAIQVGAELFMNKARFKEVSLVIARVAGNLETAGSVFGGKMTANMLRVGADLSLGSNASFHEVNLANATVGGNFAITQASFDGDLNASSLRAGANLSIYNTSFRNVDFTGAKVDANFQINDAKFEGSLNADSIQVGANLLMGGKSRFKTVILAGAKTAGFIGLNDVTIDGSLMAPAIRSAQLLVLSSTVAQPSDMRLANVSGNLDLGRSAFAALDLSGASIEGEFRLGGAEPSLSWRSKDGGLGDLTLSNTRVGSLIDATGAWPEKGHLHLDGFAFGRLGGLRRNGDIKARERDAAWWDDNWARLDSDYSPSPYQQLAAAFAASGEHDLADGIRYARYVREQENLKGMSWLWSWPLRFVAGFGVYPHWVLYWIAGVSIAGAAYLWKCSKGVRDGNHGVVWCFGASLARLLPIIAINKEFTDFFDDPKRERLTGFQMFVFSFVGALGWFLAAILIAAVSGVTGRS